MVPSQRHQDTPRRDACAAPAQDPSDAYQQDVVSGWIDSAGTDWSMQTIADSHHWMAVTIIEDDDLMFDNKPLSTWYEEGRRRYSDGDGDGEVCGDSGDSGDSSGAPSPGSSVEDEELHRGRQRDRPQYAPPPYEKPRKAKTGSHKDGKTKH